MSQLARMVPRQDPSQSQIQPRMLCLLQPVPVQSAVATPQCLRQFGFRRRCLLGVACSQELPRPVARANLRQAEPLSWQQVATDLYQQLAAAGLPSAEIRGVGQLEACCRDRWGGKEPSLRT